MPKRNSDDDNRPPGPPNVVDLATPPAPRSMALLDVPEIQLMLFAWPNLTPEQRTGNRYEISESWAHAASIPIEDVMRWFSAVIGTLAYPDGTLNPAVAMYLDARAGMKLRAGVGTHNPENNAIHFLREMPLEARLEWLEAKKLLEE